MSRAFVPTLKEVPADAQVVSHIYMVRGGFIRRLAAGVYNFLPLGWRVLRKVEEIVRQELDRAGCQELLMPAAIPGELWQESGRWEKYGPELLRFKDRKGADFCFGPTHEEVICDIVRREISSYRALPLNLYQIQGKFRDEMRPRAGLMRGREFIMKDAYSFHASEEDALHTYREMYAAYERIFKRCGLEFRTVEADTGAIGGSVSHEFQVLAESGEDAIVACDQCEYAANVEQAEVVPEPADSGAPGELTKVDTPNARTIDEVAAFLKVPPARLVKTLIYIADGKAVAALVRGDRELNEVALKKLTGATQIDLAGDKQVFEATRAPVGFAGPVGLDLPVYADEELRGAVGMATGANAKDAHYTGVDLARDVNVTAWGGLRQAIAGDTCARCKQGHYRAFRGIEVGHVFYLGTKYSQPMACNFVDEDGTSKPMPMGCYGIGITRTAAAAIEQNHDESGIIWPMSIAPYEVTVLSLQPNDPDVVAACDRIYEQLQARGVDVLYDDSGERAGVKFKNADLIGVPLRVAVGKRGLADGQVEVKWRTEKDATLTPVGEVVERVGKMVEDERARLRGLAG